MNTKSLTIRYIQKIFTLVKITLLVLIAYSSYLIATSSKKLTGFDGLLDTPMVPAAQTVTELLYEYTMDGVLLVGTFLFPLVVVLYALLVKNYGKVLIIEKRLGNRREYLLDTPNSDWFLLVQRFIFSSVFFAQILNSSLYIGLVVNAGDISSIETLVTLLFMLFLLFVCVPLYLVGLKPLVSYCERVQGINKDDAINSKYSVRVSVFIAIIGTVISVIRWRNGLIDFFANFPLSLFEGFASCINLLFTMIEVLF